MTVARSSNYQDHSGPRAQARSGVRAQGGVWSELHSLWILWYEILLLTFFRSHSDTDRRLEPCEESEQDQADRNKGSLVRDIVLKRKIKRPNFLGKPNSITESIFLNAAHSHSHVGKKIFTLLIEPPLCLLQLITHFCRRRHERDHRTACSHRCITGMFNSRWIFLLSWLHFRF